ncbi:MAG: extracellular solute-binding protein [Clostridiales bacterium]|nr:extracellular solute-binding protein [Clostridiales bacterium]
MKVSRIFALLLAAMLMFGLFAGCTGGTSTGTAATTAAGTTAATTAGTTAAAGTTAPPETPSAPEGSDPYAEGSFAGYPMVCAAGETLSLYLQTGPGYNKAYTSFDESPFHVGLEEHLGVDIDWRMAPAGTDGNQAYNLMIASGDLTEIMYVWGINNDAQDFLDDEYIYALTDLYPVYAPAYWKLINDDPDKLLSTKTDSGVLYGFAFFREDLMLGTYEGPMIRKDLLDAVGETAPVTIDDWNRVLYKFQSENVVKYPLSVWGGDALDRIFTNPFGFSFGYFVDENHKTVYGESTEGYREFLKLMNKWYTDGILDPDFATNDRPAIQTKVFADEIGATRTSKGTVTSYMKPLQELGSPAEWLPLPYPVAKSGDPVYFLQAEQPSLGIQAVITTKCHNIPLAMRVLDYGYTDEGMIYWNFGYEEGGISECVDGHWRYTEEAKNHPDGISQMIQRYTGIAGNGFCLMMVDGSKSQNEGIGWEAAEIWWDGADTSRLFPPVTPTTAEGNAISNSANAISTYVSEMMYKFIMGEESIDGFDTYLEELRGMGLDTVLQIKDQQVARYFAR